MNNRGFILNIVAIIVVLCIIYFSQQANFKSVGTETQQKSQNYLTQGIEWVKANIYPRVATEVQSRGEDLTKQVNTQKNNITQNVWDGIKNYFAEKFNSIFKTEVK